MTEEYDDDAKTIAPHSYGYVYWINNASHVTWTHPNDWIFENPDSVNYIKTFYGTDKPGVLFEGIDIIRTLDMAESLEQAKEAFEWRISLEDDIDRKEYLE